MSVTLVCDDCNRKVTMSQEKFEEKDDWYCKECNGIMSEEDKDERCFNCKKTSDDLNECAECGEYVCEECIIQFDSADNICRKCIDKFYPRKVEYQDKIVEKIVEKPIIQYVDKEGIKINKETFFDPNAKTRFD
jgi:methionyl-tRNA synthetase